MTTIHKPTLKAVGTTMLTLVFNPPFCFNRMIDILAFAAHPDDVELSCAGTLIAQKAKGHSIGIIDMTRGELGTRGTAETRDQEAQDSAKIMGLDIRENLDLGDGFFEETKENMLKVVWAIRKYRPKILLANAIMDRHPDHARASKLVERAAFFIWFG